MRLAIIPARGGSKRIPRKNIRIFSGLPMIAWSIKVAIQSGCFDRVVVSTDEVEIADIARQFGAETPFFRPSELSDDHVGTIPVIAHAISWFNANVGRVSQACCIYATAPFLRKEDLLEGRSLLNKFSADYAFSVTRYPFPIQRAIRINGAGRVQMFQPNLFDTRSQDLEEAWHDAGQFYWGTPESWLEHKPFFSLNSVPVILPSYRVQDIDNVEDWTRAELMFEIIKRVDQL